MLWPDSSPDWRNVDEYPDTAARARAWNVIERASKLDVTAALALAASKSDRALLGAALDETYNWTLAFLACFCDWRRFWGPGEVRTIMIVPADRRQARTIMRYAPRSSRKRSLKLVLVSVTLRSPGAPM
jgi:hypothetical protein